MSMISDPNCFQYSIPGLWIEFRYQLRDTVDTRWKAIISILADHRYSHLPWNRSAQLARICSIDIEWI